jgi:hypothetical protein
MSSVHGGGAGLPGDRMVVLPAPLLQNETNARLNLQTPACVWSIYSNRFCIAKA